IIDPKTKQVHHKVQEFIRSPLVRVKWPLCAHITKFPFIWSARSNKFDKVQSRRRVQVEILGNEILLPENDSECLRQCSLERFVPVYFSILAPISLVGTVAR